MVIDHKRMGRSHRGQGGRHRWRRRLALASILLLLSTGSYWYYCGRRLRRAADLVRAAEPLKARRILLAASKGWLRRGDALAGLVGLAALDGDEAAARHRMEEARAQGKYGSPIPVELVFDGCFKRADYELASDLGTFYWESGRSDLVDYYLGAAQFAIGKLDEAEAALTRVSPISTFGDRASRMKERIREARKTGARPLLLDRNRRPLCLRRIREGAVEVLSPALSPLILGAKGWVAALEAKRLRQTYLLTIDADLELLADAALGKYAGSLVVLDPKTGKVLAYASHPEGESVRRLDFGEEGTFEPGSVIKIATYLTALNSNVAMKNVFPLPCMGWMPLSGKQFFDWKAHGKVASIDDALAVSCNLAFAKLGLQAGKQELADTLRRFGFTHPALPPFRFGELAPIASDRDLANASIGLGKVAATPMQLAMLAQAVANEGLSMKPLLVEQVLDVRNAPVERILPEPLLGDEAASRVASPEAVARLVSGMKQVVASDEGTGRRARMEKLSLALKTGTAGNKKSGLDAVMVGFAPADHPVLAFGLFAAHAGKSEFEGARIIRTFLESVRSTTDLFREVAPPQASETNQSAGRAEPKTSDFQSKPTGQRENRLRLEARSATVGGRWHGVPTSKGEST